MSAGSLARYATIAGLSLAVKVVATGHDKFGPVIVLKVTGAPKGSAYRRNEVFTVSADSIGISGR